MGKYNKVSGAAAAGALTTVMVFGIQTWKPDLEIPVEAVAAITWIITSIATYFAPANTLTVVV